MIKELSVEQITKLEQFLENSRNFDRKFWQAQKDFEDRIKTQNLMESSRQTTEQKPGLLLDISRKPDVCRHRLYTNLRQIALNSNLERISCNDSSLPISTLLLQVFKNFLKPSMIT